MIYQALISLIIFSVSFYTLDFYIILALLSLSLVIFLNFYKLDKKTYIVFFLMFSLSIFNYNFRVQNKKIKKGIYIENIKIKKGKAELNKINSKYLNKKLYLSLNSDKLINLQGNLKVKFNLYELKETERFYLARGKIIAYKETQLQSIKNSISKFLKKKVDSMYRGKPGNTGFLYAVLLGERDNLDKDYFEAFKKTGTAHLLVISGLHIGILIYFILLFSELCKFSYKLKYILAILVLSMYVFSIQSSYSIMRSYIMGMTFLLGKLLNEKSDPKKSISFSFVLMTLINPLAIFSVSFQLSYIAVFSLLLFPVPSESKLERILYSSLIVQLALTPLFLYYFHTLPLFSLIVNVLLINLAPLIIILSFISLILEMVFGFLNILLLPILHFFIRIMDALVGAFEYSTILNIKLYTSFSAISIIYVYLSFYLIYYKKEKLYKYIPAFVLVFFIFQINILNTKEIKFRKNIFIKSKNGARILVLNDELSEFDLYFLRQKGVKYIDCLVYKKGIRHKNLKKFLKLKRKFTVKKEENLKIDNFEFILKKGMLSILEKDV